MNKNYMFKLIEEVDKVKLNSIIYIKKEGNTEEYKVEFDKEFHDFELISLDRPNTIWGSCGDDIEELKRELLCNGIKGSYEDILVLPSK